jgi:hypothetical protein
MVISDFLSVSVRLDLESPDVRPAVVGDVEHRVIGAKADPVGRGDPGVGCLRLAGLHVHQRHLLPARVGDVDVAARGDGQVVGAEAVGDHRLFPARRVECDQRLAAAGVEPAVGAGPRAAAAAGGELGLRAIRREPVDAGIGAAQIGEEDVAVPVVAQPVGKAQAFDRDLPVVAGEEDLRE